MLTEVLIEEYHYLVKEAFNITPKVKNWYLTHSDKIDIIIFLTYFLILSISIRSLPGPIFAKLKNGICITLENGTVIKPEQVLEEAVPGRYVSIICSIEIENEESLDELFTEKMFKR